jgi:hypothetical protein
MSLQSHFAEPSSLTELSDDLVLSCDIRAITPPHPLNDYLVSGKEARNVACKPVTQAASNLYTKRDITEYLIYSATSLYICRCKPRLTSPDNDTLACIIPSLCNLLNELADWFRTSRSFHQYFTK